MKQTYSVIARHPDDPKELLFLRVSGDNLPLHEATWVAIRKLNKMHKFKTPLKDLLSINRIN